MQEPTLSLDAACSPLILYLVVPDTSDMLVPRFVIYL